MKSIAESGECVITFVSAVSKLAPRSATTIPRLELSAALLAALHVRAIAIELRITIDAVYLYSDSMVVLGYLRNRTKCFSKYVARRVEATLRLYDSSKWSYVPTELNPADLATRPSTPAQVEESMWFSGPRFLTETDPRKGLNCEPDAIVDLPESLPTAIVHRTAAPSGVERTMWSECASRVSRWMILVNVVRRVLAGLMPRLDSSRQRLGVSLAPRPSDSSVLEAQRILFQSSQREVFPTLFDQFGCVKASALKDLPTSHPLNGLVPHVSNDLIRVGGRLRNAVSPFEEKHPVILHSESVITKLFVEHVHRRSPHQGKLITSNKIREAGVFVVGGRRLVEAIIEACVTCKRLRGAEASQVMSDLPTERLAEGAPFDHVGLDVFGPYHITQGKSTRRTSGSTKQFVLLLNCLVSRAIHLEPLESMNTTAVMNAIRRFVAIRGPCRSMLSDRGSNFVGAIGQTEQFQKFQEDLEAGGVVWKLNPVGASHFGGAYERKIGSVRRVLEGTLITHPTALTRDEFSTLLQEAAAVVNSTPLYKTPEGADEPQALSPSMLLTLKTKFPSPPPESFTTKDLLAYGTRRWRRIQFLADSFWQRWRENYIQELSILKRSKWSKLRRNLVVGEVVMLREKNVPRGDWRTAVVRRLCPSSDGLVRRVVVAFADARGQVREAERAIATLVPLFVP